MKIIKRSGAEAVFDISKIITAIDKANHEVVQGERLTMEEIHDIAQYIEDAGADMRRSLNVEEIQDLVEDRIMDKRAFSVARKYITYRYQRALVRKSNSTDEQILSLIECNNEEVKQENSNKNPTVNSVQRDCRRTNRGSSISMMRIILRSICTTAIWSILRTCCRTGR